jgi:hypothetical protein
LLLEEIEALTRQAIRIEENLNQQDYLVRVMWSLLKRGTTWEEGVAPADEPKGPARAIATA